MGDLIKLLIVTNSLAKGGAEKLIEVTIPHFHSLGIQVTLLLLDKKKSFEPYIQTIEELGVQIIDLQAKNLYNLSIILKIKKILRTNNYNVVHVHLFPSLYHVSLAYKLLPNSVKKKSKLIYTEHSNYNNRRKYKIFQIIDRWIYRSYSQLIAITDEVKNNLDKWLGDTVPIIVIKNGVDIQYIHSVLPYSKSEIFTELNIDTNSKILLMSASFRYPKDQLTLIHSLRYLSEDFHVLFAGEGPEMSNIKNIVATQAYAHRVHFLGFRGDVLSLMKSADINILSSNYEGLSGVTLEGLAAGRPFIGSDVKGIQDIVPSQLFLFPPTDSYTLAEKITAICKDENLQKEMILQGQNHALKYDIHEMVHGYIKLYRTFTDPHTSY